MPKKISRRKALTTGIATTSIASGFACTPNKTSSEKKNVPYSERSWWGPGGNKDYIRNLIPGSTPVRLACMTPKTMLNYPENGSITEMVKRVRDHGYTAANGHYGMGSRNKWLDAGDSEIREFKEALKKYDVDFYDIMIWTNLLHPDERKRQSNIKYVCEAFEAAERCGVRSITGITGSMAPGDYSMHTLMHPDNWTKEAWKRSVDSIRQILKDTSGYKTVWGMEQCITTNIDSPMATKCIIEDVADPRCKCVLDVSNMISLATYFHSTELIDEVFDLLGEDIVGCHAKDFKLNNRMYVDLVEVPPGKGIQDYETYLVRMSRLKWSRTLMLEHFPENEYPAAKAFIEKTAGDVGVKIYG